MYLPGVVLVLWLSGVVVSAGRGGHVLPFRVMLYSLAWTCDKMLMFLISSHVWSQMGRISGETETQPDVRKKQTKSFNKKNHVHKQLLRKCSLFLFLINVDRHRLGSGISG